MVSPHTHTSNPAQEKFLWGYCRHDFTAKTVSNLVLRFILFKLLCDNHQLRLLHVQCHIVRYIGQVSFILANFVCLALH